VTDCPLDTDGDGNCPKHPNGCDDALWEEFRRQRKVRIGLNGGPRDGDQIEITEAQYDAGVVQVPELLDMPAEFPVDEMPETGEVRVLTYKATRWANRYGREWKTWEWQEI